MKGKPAIIISLCSESWPGYSSGCISPLESASSWKLQTRGRWWWRPPTSSRERLSKRT